MVIVEISFVKMSVMLLVIAKNIPAIVMTFVYLSLYITFCPFIKDKTVSYYFSLMGLKGHTHTLLASSTKSQLPMVNPRLLLKCYLTWIRFFPYYNPNHWLRINLSTKAHPQTNLASPSPHRPFTFLPRDYPASLLLYLISSSSLWHARP